VGNPVLTFGQEPSGTPTPTDTPTPTVTLTPTDTPTPTVTPTPDAPTLTPTSCPGCTRLGYLSVWGPTAVMPLRPVVGDEVTLRYRVDYRLPGGVGCGPFESCRLEGGEAHLKGDAAPVYESLTQEIVARRRVVSAGVATIRLHVTAMTEDECYDSDPERGCVRYFNWTDIEAFSEPFELQLFESGPTPTFAPPNTPTSTPGIPTPTSTCACGPPDNEESDGGGCDIRGTRGGSPWLWLTGLALFVVLRRRSSARRLT